MGATEGNKFWQLRSQHGREAIFSDPVKLWDAACSYFEWCESNPLIEIDYRGKDATQVKLEKMRPFTMQGLCLFLGINTKYFHEFKTTKTYQDNKDFPEIVTRIEETVYNQKFTGAAAGFLNPNIIARDLGLSDKKEITEVPQTLDLSKLSDEELTTFINLQSKVDNKG